MDQAQRLQLIFDNQGPEAALVEALDLWGVLSGEVPRSVCATDIAGRLREVG